MNFKTVIHTITTSKTLVSQSRSLRFYLGKKVHSLSGDVVGTVKDVLLD